MRRGLGSPPEPTPARQALGNFKASKTGEFSVDNHTEGGLGGPEIQVRVAPGEVLKVFWRGPSGRRWRTPHDWQRRRIKLPDREGLLRNGPPRNLAEELASRIVAVNYHPGSLCCLPTDTGSGTAWQKVARQGSRLRGGELWRRGEKVCLSGLRHVA